MLSPPQRVGAKTKLILCSIFRNFKMCTYIQRRTESEICNASAILEISGKVNLFVILNRSIDSPGRFRKFFFPLNLLIGEEGEGISRGSVRGQLTPDQCFVETRKC